MAYQVLTYDVCHYGHLSWITPLAAFFALWLFLFPAFRCSLTVGKPPLQDIEVFVGYWSRESTEIAAANIGNDGNYCVGWLNNDTFDGIWKFGRALGVLGAITTSITTIIDLFFLCMRLPLNWFIPLIGMHILNAIFSILLLIGLASSTCEADHCHIARGGYFAIIACLLWLIVAYLVWLLRLRERDFPEEYYDEDDPPKKKKKKTMPPPTDETEEADIEQPLALMPPPSPPKSPRRTAQPSSPRKKKKSNNNDQPPLALPPSENSTSSSRRSNTTPSQSPSKRNKRLMNSSSTSEQDKERLALPMSENTASPRKKKPSKQKMITNVSSNDDNDNNNSKGRKKKRGGAPP